MYVQCRYLIHVHVISRCTSVYFILQVCVTDFFKAIDIFHQPLFLAEYET